MNRNRKMALASVTAGLAATGQLGGPAGAVDKAQSAGPLSDLRANVDATDGAVAYVSSHATASGGTHVRLKLQNLGHAVLGESFGAHVHVGPCLEGNGEAALGHHQGPTSSPPPPR